MSPKSQENFDILMRLQLDGIGASLQSIDGYATIAHIVPGGAADKQGELKAGDKVLGVGQGDDGDFVDCVDSRIDDVVGMIRGKRGTKVRLQVQREGESETKIVTITRASIELSDSEAQGEIFEQQQGGRTVKVGVIDLPSFYMDMDGARRGLPDYKSTTRDVLKILQRFNEQKVEVLVIDLRQNGGGSLTEAISLTGLFIDEGPVVQVKDSDGRVQHYDDPDAGVAWGGPLVVLTSEHSASASEIFAGAIQDYRRGLIVGDETTHGKGTVQTLLDLGRKLFRVSNPPKMGALKITIQQFYRPDGDSTQNRGVVSDIVLPSLASEIGQNEAELDYALAFDRVDRAPHERMDMVDSRMIERLTALSTERRSQDPEFQKLVAELALFREQRAKKAQSLNEERFLAERAKLNPEKKEEEEAQNQRGRSGIKRDFYLDEAIAIACDYLLQVNMARAN
jgi:carboxyl-terminal processing protease